MTTDRSSDKFQVVGGSLVGPGLPVDVRDFVELAGVDDAVKKRLLEAVVEVANVSYRDGRASVLPMWDDRYELHGAVESLRALGVIMGPMAGERHRRAADIIGRMLQEYERSGG
jgi:hypothetical protein